MSQDKSLTTDRRHKSVFALGSLILTPIMLIRLLRNVPQGLALTGRLYVDSLISEEGHHQYQLSMDTLENLQYAIPDGFYRLRLTYSPRFQELLPLLDNVFGYYSGGSESCRMVQNGVESSSIENTMLHNSTQPLNNATLPLNNATQPLHNATQPLHNSTQPLHNATPSAHRTGIRIHAGNTIEHTTGCILVGDLACLEDASPKLRERSKASNCLENGGDAASTSLIASSPLASSPDRLLSSRKRLEELRTYLLNYLKQNPYEEIYIQLESPDPYPNADTPCNYEQQQHIQESLQRAHRLREERRGCDEVMSL